MKGDREESLLIIKKKNQTALDLGNGHFPLSRAALIGVLTWCVGLLDQPSFSKIVRGLTRICSPQHMSTMFCAKEKQIGHRKQRNSLNAFENCYSCEKVWLACSCSPTSFCLMSFVVKDHEVSRFQGVPCHPCALSTTVSPCKTLNEVLVTPSILRAHGKPKHLAKCCWFATTTIQELDTH